MKIGDNDTKGKLSTNIIFLGASQVFGILIPIFLLPIYAKRLGIEAYGSYSIAFSFFLVISSLIESGFNTRGVSIISSSDSDEEINSFLASSFVIRFFVGILLSFLSSLLWILMGKENAAIISVFFFLSAISVSLNPQWAMIGLQKFAEISILSIVSRIVIVIFTLLLVRDKSDLFLALCINLIAYIINLIFFVYSRRIFPVKLDLNYILAISKDLLPYSFSNSVSLIITSAAPIGLGMYLDAKITGGVTAVERITKTIASINVTLHQVTFPFFSRRIAHNKRDYMSIVLPYSVLVGVAFSVLTILSIAFSKGIIHTLLSDEFIPFTRQFEISLLYLPVSVINSIFGITVMTNIGMVKYYNLSMAIAAIVAFVFYFLLPPFLGSYASPFGLVASEITLFIAIAFFLTKERRV